MIDSQICFRLTNRVLSYAKRDLLKIINPEFKILKSKKVKKTDDDEAVYENIIDVFEHENEL